MEFSHEAHVRNADGGWSWDKKTDKEGMVREKNRRAGIMRSQRGRGLVESDDVGGEINPLHDPRNKSFFFS